MPERAESSATARPAPAADPDARAVAAFWERFRAATGCDAHDRVPPAWSFGWSAELADRLLDRVLHGEKTATASAVWEYEAEGEPLPTIGDLSIVCDAEGRPRALIRTTSVRIVPFEDVDADHARAEGEDDRTVASWRAAHRLYLVDGEGRDRPEGLRTRVVLERFEVLAPATAR